MAAPAGDVAADVAPLRSATRLNPTVGRWVTPPTPYLFLKGKTHGYTTSKLFASLKQIRYSGENIGSDLSFAFEANGKTDFFKRKIRLGQGIPVA